MSNTFNWKNLPITVQLRAGGGGAPGTVDTPSSQILGKGSFLLISLGTCHRALSLALPISTLKVWYCGGIFEQSMGTRNRVGIGLSYRPARLQRLAELIHWNRFLGSLKV